MDQARDVGAAPKPVVDLTGKSSGIGRLLLLGIVLVGVAGAFVVLPEQYRDQAMLALLGLLSMIGVFFLFVLAIGIVHLTSRSRGLEFARSFVDGLTEGVVITDNDGRIMYANQAYADLSGAESASDINTVERLFSSEADASEAVYRLSQDVRGNQSGQHEFRMASGLKARSSGGNKAAWYRLQVRPLQVPGQNKSLRVWQVQDITEERTSQEQVFLELQHAISYLDHAPAGFFSADPDGSIVYLNATLSDWLGIDLTQFSARQMRMQDLVAGDGMALLDAITLEPGESRTAVVDLDLAKTNGQTFPVRLYHLVPQSDDGAPGATRTVVLNRSESEVSSDALEAAESRFTRFFNNTPIGIASVGNEGQVIKTNARFLKLFAPVLEGRASEDQIRIHDLVHENDQPSMMNAIGQADDGQANIEFVDSVLPNAEDCSIRYFLSPVSEAERDDEGEVAIIYALEVTEQRALEAQMAQSQKMQAVGQLAGGIAHDFNNVLTAIIGFSDLLLTRHQATDPSFQDIINIKQNANRAASLVRQLLAFSRRQTLRPEILSLSDVLSDLRMLLDRLMGDKVKLEVVHGRDLWPLRADIGQLEQVVVNLCVNARDAMPEGGDLKIKTSNLEPKDLVDQHAHKEMASGDYVLIEVIDKGTGMSAETLEKIFEPFFSTKEIGQGTGLGLSTVYGIVKQSGGYIFADTELGAGTTFRVYLPRHVPTAQELEEQHAEKNQSAQEKPKDLTGSATILLVEDEDAVRAFGARALQSRGYTVLEAESGVEALELVDEHEGEIDLVVSDVVMPEMDGPTLFTELKKREYDLKFIFVSGYAEDAFAKNLPDADREKFGFLPKPFSLKQLASTVKDMLEK
ncbi:MAG: response regulator [Pseudomonadota bacterium]